MNTIPKSLHTVTSLVNLARYLADIRGVRPEMTHVRAAANILGFAGCPDDHDLMEVAARKLAKLAK